MTEQTLPQPKKGNKMATDKVDVNKLLAEIEKFSPRDFALFAVKANEIQVQKKKQQLKEIAELYIESLASAGFTKEEGIEALGVKTASDGTVKIVSRAKNGTAKKVKGPQAKWGQTYKNPDTGETWTKSASGKGQLIKWLKDAIENGKTFEELEA